MDECVDDAACRAHHGDICVWRGAAFEENLSISQTTSDLPGRVGTLGELWLQAGHHQGRPVAKGSRAVLFVRNTP